SCSLAAPRGASLRRTGNILLPSRMCTCAQQPFRWNFVPLSLLAQKRPPRGTAPAEVLMGIEDLPPSAARLAAARGIDLFPERLEADRADHDIVADHVARRAVEPERFGELETFLQGRLHLGARHILVEPRNVEAAVLGVRK